MYRYLRLLGLTPIETLRCLFKSSLMRMGSVLPAIFLCEFLGQALDLSKSLSFFSFLLGHSIYPSLRDLTNKSESFQNFLPENSWLLDFARDAFSFTTMDPSGEWREWVALGERYESPEENIQKPSRIAPETPARVRIAEDSPIVDEKEEARLEDPAQVPRTRRRHHDE